MKTPPYAHQLEDYELSRDQIGYAWWWEMGLGKSKLLIDNACYLYTHGLINGLLVIAPKGVHINLCKHEMPVHAWDEVPWRGFTWEGPDGRRAYRAEMAAILESPGRGSLDVVAINYEAIRTEKGFAFVKKFLESHECMMALDESTAISSPTALQTKACHRLAPLAAYRRVMSGTPITDGPFDIYSPMKFVDTDFWKEFGLSSYWVFKTRFAAFQEQRGSQGQRFQQLLYYRDLDELARIVQTRSTRRLKEDVLDLPAKLYKTVEFDMLPEQRRTYDEVRSQLYAEIEDGDAQIDAASALIKLMRLQQITSGFVTATEKVSCMPGDLIVWSNAEFGQFQGEVVDVVDDRVIAHGVRVEGGVDVEQVQIEIQASSPALVRLTEAKRYLQDLMAPDDNPRLKILETFIEPIRHKIIIFAKFTRDLDNITTLLGNRCRRYDGQVNGKDRELALDLFRNDPEVQYLVVNPAALSMGVTLTIAKTVIYYSNDFNLQRRLQSEDRAHRIGQDQNVLVVDIVAAKSVDEKIHQALRKKFSIAAQVNGDRLREWLS